MQVLPIHRRIKSQLVCYFYDWFIITNIENKFRMSKQVPMHSITSSRSNTPMVDFKSKVTYNDPKDAAKKTNANKIIYREMNHRVETARMDAYKSLMSTASTPAISHYMEMNVEYAQTAKNNKKCRQFSQLALRHDQNQNMVGLFLFIF